MTVDVGCAIERSNSLLSLVDTKLKADVAESAVVTELLKRGFQVLRPVGDRLPYDLAISCGGRLLRIQVKSAWYEASKNLYTVDARRTKTNRRRMVRDRYTVKDFDFAIIYLPDREVFYVIPVKIFVKYRSGISLVESRKRQRKPRSTGYKGRWGLISKRAAQ